eukprot:CAMPEP_0118865032 /NCGR_PEP_ID=MMETSP1163-20130328/9427_1 /TAXON_ID=124430 /ORGANISM="Phaeomonas parva, Strain CCMP2877" /LENGTH=70 /DNA_ID=CAMNT_0006799223 /DNA_START=515 /DNA_END=727 /DNA_ORIENTATION=-
MTSQTALVLSPIAPRACPARPACDNHTARPGGRMCRSSTSLPTLPGAARAPEAARRAASLRQRLSSPSQR